MARLRITWRSGHVSHSRHVTRAEAEAMLPAFNLPQVKKVEVAEGEYEGFLCRPEHLFPLTGANLPDKSHT